MKQTLTTVSRTRASTENASIRLEGINVRARSRGPELTATRNSTRATQCRVDTDSALLKATTEILHAAAHQVLLVRFQ